MYLKCHNWFKTCAMADLLGKDDPVAAKDTIYRCMNKLCEHKEDLFSFLKTRWTLLFDASYDVRLPEVKMRLEHGSGCV